MTRRSGHLSLVFLAAAVTCSTVVLAVRVQPAANPTPDDLLKHSTLALEEALKGPERLLSFIAEPGTSYKERRAATLRGAAVVPPEFVPRLMKMIGELRDEQRLHQWAIEPHPHDATPFLRRPNINVTPRKRSVLGHEWTVPEQSQPYPTSFDQESAAPWPWQVQQCLDDLLIWMASRGRETGGPGFGDRWMEACLTMPASSDREALLVVEATLGGSWMHHKSIAVMQRYLAVALDPQLPQAAAVLASRLGEECWLWQDPAARDIGDVVTAAIIERSPHPEARARAAYGIRHLTENAPAEPVLSVFAACERATKDEIDPWDRLYVFAISAASGLREPPIPTDRDPMVRPGSSEAATMLATFEKWYAQRRPELVERAAKRRAELKELIKRLEPNRES